jgi:hypothetical protein
MRFKSWTLSLLAVMLMSACAPAALPAQPPAVEVSQPPAAPPAPETAAPAPAESEPAAVVVTPRGDALEASDPSTVNLASGQPQLVEFFRFT